MPSNGKQTGRPCEVNWKRSTAIRKHELNELHCIIHQENLRAKSLRIQSVINVVKTINFVRPRGLNHRLFQELLYDLDSEFGDVVYYSEVRWLSRGKTSV